MSLGEDGEIQATTKHKGLFGRQAGNAMLKPVWQRAIRTSASAKVQRQCVEGQFPL